MKKRTVIKNLPVRFPLTSTILFAFLLDYYDVADIWWGVFITIYSILWIGLIAAKFNEDKIDLDEIITDLDKAQAFERGLNKKKGNRFQAKMNDLMKKQYDQKN